MAGPLETLNARKARGGCGAGRSVRPTPSFSGVRGSGVPQRIRGLNPNFGKFPEFLESRPGVPLSMAVTDDALCLRDGDPHAAIRAAASLEEALSLACLELTRGRPDLLVYAFFSPN